MLGATLLMALNGGVRADQKCDTDKPETTPTSRFEVNVKQGTVFDTKTKLTWKICAEGTDYLYGEEKASSRRKEQPYSNGHCTEDVKFTWDFAAKSLKDNTGWRLPNIDELKSIVEKRCTEPSINLQVFPDTQALTFWSASYDPGDTDYAYNIYFGRGLVGNDLKINAFYVRLVKGEQWHNDSETPIKNK